MFRPVKVSRLHDCNTQRARNVRHNTEISSNVTTWGHFLILCLKGNKHNNRDNNIIIYYFTKVVIRFQHFDDIVTFLSDPIVSLAVLSVYNFDIK